MYKETDFEELSVPELIKEKEWRSEIINLNNRTGIQSDFDRKTIDDESKRFESEIYEIDKVIKRKEE